MSRKQDTMFRIERVWRSGEAGAAGSGRGAKTLGHTLERMRSSLPTDVSLGTAAIPHDIIQRFPWYPLIGSLRLVV